MIIIIINIVITITTIIVIITITKEITRVRDVIIKTMFPISRARHCVEHSAGRLRRGAN
jgi:hypothetical protein